MLAFVEKTHKTKDYATTCVMYSWEITGDGLDNMGTLQIYIGL